MTLEQELPEDRIAGDSAEGNAPEAATTTSEDGKSVGTREADPADRFREMQRTRQNVQARVIKWQRNGLEVQLEDGTNAFMPNDMIDRDPNRNVAHYFGKTVPVRVTSVKGGGKKQPEITVSHRAVIDDEMRAHGKEKIQSLNQDDVIDAKIKSFTKDGALVDLGPGIDAIIRTRDLSWSPIEHPYEAVKRGETVQAKILQVDKGRRRVQLGIRQLTPDPFLEKFEKYKVDQTIQGEVLRTNDFGAEIQLESDLTAFLPISEIAWNRIESVAHVLKPGDIVEAKIITLDADKRKITVSRKQMIENPMRKIESTFRIGTDHNATIKEVTKGGVVVALEHDAEGFVPRRELSHDRIERLEDVFKAGKPLENLRVIDYDRRNGKITLSAIEAEREAQKKTLKNYKATSKASSFTIGDLASLKEKLERIEREG